MKIKNLNPKPYFQSKNTLKLLLANPEGVIYEHPRFDAAVWDGQNWLIPGAGTLIPLPPGSKLFTLPERLPVGYDPETGDFIPISEFNDGEYEFQPWAVSAFLPPAYMRLLLPAYMRMTDAACLPQWAYAAVAGGENGIYAAALRVDQSGKWEPAEFDDSDLIAKIEEFLSADSDNRLLRHIAHCATHYHCFAAKNLFLKRWEAPLPVARKCNASCLGCLSLQTGETPCSHQRISFTPAPEEIAQVAVNHLKYADEPMVSFGQGCEGEPLTEWKLVCESIKMIRAQTNRGTIHLNTNGSIPEAVPHLAKAGLNSVRISLNSARKINYYKYFRPDGYAFDDVIRFIEISKTNGLFVHINLLVFPGVNDSEAEIDAFSSLVGNTEVDLVQLKNLNIDPDFYLEAMQIEKPALGMMKMVDVLRGRIPELRFGYFNLQKEEFSPPAR
ncbi:MAG: radical SAM protein [candidate division Zixibacteria bacterium]|nr:radical SAM protein [Candidatus Tariuqbacter arcticus]